MTITVEHLSKSFPGTQALADVGLRIEAGRVHALAGANGSGKSTLVRVLTGVYQPDAGVIDIDGTRHASIATPAEASSLGIRVVHQEAPLIDTLSVAECVALFRGYPRRAFGAVAWKTLQERVGHLFKSLDIDIDPALLAGKLAPAERALVALAIALDGIEGSNGTLILDEATASLPEEDAESFLRRVKDLARRGISVLMVTHRIREVPDIADEVTVLANGRVVYHGSSEGVTEEFIIEKMVGVTGASLASEGSEQATKIDELWSAAGRADVQAPRSGPALEVVDLAGGTVKGVTFSVAAGEIVGITGLASSGVTDLPYLLAAALPRASGWVRIHGRELAPSAGPPEAIDVGIALVPADRLRQGGVRSLPVRDNIVLPDAQRYWRRAGLERSVIETAMTEFDVQPHNPSTLFERLSGGNQQKVVLSKWLLLRPTVVILDDPTSGVDPASRRLVFDAVHAAAANAIGVVLFTSEHEQLLAHCQRVLVLRDGAIAAELSGSSLDATALATWSYA